MHWVQQPRRTEVAEAEAEAEVEAAAVVVEAAAEAVEAVEARQHQAGLQ
jgi:hypothetical protein